MKLKCNSCKEEKDEEEFYHSKKYLSGFNQGKCKECYHVAKKEAFLARQTGIILHCKTCDQDKDSSEFSPHKQCASGFDISRCKPCKKAKVSWAKQPLDKKIFNRAKHRAKIKGWDFDIELSDIILPINCPVFGKPLIYGDIDWAYSIDRTDSTKGYVKGNITIMSNKANRAKNNLTVEEMTLVLEYMKGANYEVGDLGL